MARKNRQPKTANNIAAVTERFNRCSFCETPPDKIQKLVLSPVDKKTAICGGCLETQHSFLSDDGSLLEHFKKHVKIAPIPVPRAIVDYLDKHVIGQEKAKKTLSVAMHNHYKRIKCPEAVNVEKANLLIIGPTGVGKTRLVKKMSERMDVPMVDANATSMTQAGWRGDDAEGIFSRLFAESGFDVERAQTGIIFIDEFDKKAVRRESGTGRDSSGEGVQQDLLKFVEGTFVEVRDRAGKLHKLDTRNILFIFGGAFVGLDDIIAERKSGRKTPLGFQGDETSLDAAKETVVTTAVGVTKDDLVKFGIIPEMAGRMPIVTTLEALDEKSLVRILTEPENNLISQYKALVSANNGPALNFASGALEAIAKAAMAEKTNARGLKGILENVLEEIMFEAPSMPDLAEVTITADVVNGKAQPIYITGEMLAEHRATQKAVAEAMPLVVTDFRKFKQEMPTPQG